MNEPIMPALIITMPLVNFAFVISSTSGEIVNNVDAEHEILYI